MILHKMTLTNFRQFRGTQELEFASGDKDNVTVIFGENGRGKTSIYRALLFCLYGEKQLSQDAQVDSRELYLVNYPEMEKNAEGKNPIKAIVKLEFTHAAQGFQLERSIRGMLHDGEVVEEDAGSSLVIRDENGNSKTTRDPDQIQALISKILDRGLREYFLFDGEKIERLTRASSDQRREISNGVRKLLNIDTLETATRAMDRLRRYLDKEVESRATGELAQVIRSLRELDEERSVLEDRVDQIDEELELASIEKRQVDSELEKIREIRGLLSKRDELERRLEELGEQTKGYLGDMKNATGKTALLLVKSTASRIFGEIDKRKQMHEIPSEIRRDFIDRLISEGHCICGCPIESGSAEELSILQWRNRTKDVTTEDSMLDLWRYLGSLNNQYEDISLFTDSLLQKYAVAKNDVRIVESRLKQVREEIGSSERADAGRLEKHRETIERKKFNLETEQTVARSKLKTIGDNYEKLEIRRTEIEHEQGIRDEMSKRAELASLTSRALKEIQEEFTGEARDLISMRGTKYFTELLDKESLQTLRSIAVSSDYSIQVYDRWRKPFLANVSSGQRQIMSIAFIAALASVASGEGVLEMPLFMDTPFGRLSQEHRRNLLTKVPAWCAQWVLLATDTEFGRFEAKTLRETGCWSRFYTLQGAGAGSTVIKTHDIGQADRLLLRDEAEVK